MILHDFIYEWDGKSTDGEKPVSWWPGSYHVKIVKLATDTKDISYLVPFAVILKNARINPTMNTSLRNYIHNFAQKISKEYDLDMEKTLWVEIDDTIQVTRLHPDPKVVSATLYSIPWRPIMPNELAIINPYLADM
ncbi:MAG: hypothetical protein KKE44_02525 [Proteobacteria bacterium]|nr:hypothetical protein [Pseudomonadota bacterium]MBU1581601.1 hypothetical protein [Pseudomonadota bacterium]MBU2453112.1 hypothetical protein [Pseudomonadota bacterium]MBU2628158.1 hypothetical protein [Pseudomonadota bacterium]